MKYLYLISFILLLANFSYTQKTVYEVSCPLGDQVHKAKFQIQDTLDVMKLSMELAALRYVLDSIFPNYFDHDRPLRFVIPDIATQQEPPLLLCQLSNLYLGGLDELSNNDSLIIRSQKGISLPYYCISTALFKHHTAIHVQTKPAIERRKKYTHQGNYFIKDKMLSADMKKHPTAIYKILSSISNVREYQNKYYVRISFTDIMPYLYKIYAFHDSQVYAFLEIPDIQETLSFVIIIVKDGNGNPQVMDYSAKYNSIYDQYLTGTDTSDALPYQYISYSSYLAASNTQLLENRQYQPCVLPAQLAYWLFASCKLSLRESEFKFQHK